jgi:NAD(P)-dependent dehydrogenase (short-subunit alcohol dehydrogenase family)
MMRNLADKVIVITGAGSGIGRELARSFAAENCRLALSDINEKGLNETVAQLRMSDDRVTTHIVDVSDREASEQFALAVVEKFGQVDVLINNAGLASVGMVDEVSYEAFHRVIDVNMWGVVYGCRAFLPYLKQRPESVLANVSSINGMVPFMSNGPYNMSKYAVYGLNETLMMELRDTPVHVLSIHPGGIKTDIVNSSIGVTAENKAGFAKLANTTAEQAATAIVKAIKAKRSYLFIGPDAKFMQFLKRLSPRLTLRIMIWLTARVLPQKSPIASR